MEVCFVTSIRPGIILKGFCAGAFGRDSYDDKRVESVGVDWVVAREMNDGVPVFANTRPESLEPFIDQPVECTDG